MTEDFIPTRGSTASKSKIDYKSVTFESYKPKQNVDKSHTKREAKDTSGNEFNIKKAKHEVVKFGTAGFDPQKKQEAKVRLAIKLGAKPPKNTYRNYRVLQEERAKQKEVQAKELQFQQLGKNAIGKSVAKGKGYDRKRRKEKNGILDVYGKVTKNKNIK